jgi:hypothetical protein
MGAARGVDPERSKHNDASVTKATADQRNQLMGPSFESRLSLLGL